MNLTKSAIEHNRVTYMMLFVVAVMGVLGYNKLARDSMPPYTIRVATVVSEFPGASPERVEDLVTSKIEEAIQELPEVKDITSESRTGLSVVTVEVEEYYDEEDMQPIWDHVRRKIDEIREDLPKGVDPWVKDDDIGVVYGIMLGLENNGFSMKELKDKAEDIRDNLIKLPDASRVEIGGIQEEQIFVEFDNARLSEIGLTSAQLEQIIGQTNIVFPGGEVNLKNQRVILEPTGNFESISDLKKTLVSYETENGIEEVKLGDITNITRSYKDPTDRIVKINGKTAISISVAVTEGANLIKLGQDIDKRVALYNKTLLPVGMSLKRVATLDFYVQDKINNFMSNVIQAIGIVLVVMLLFLGIRTGMVVASLIPMAIISTLMLMYFFNMGLNQVSLAALIMALGMLVDNAIVVSESIMVKMEEGTEAKQAAIETAKELTLPLLISSLTTSAAFLPFFLAKSTMGEITGPIFVVITMALLSSWMMAMTLVAMLAVMFIRVKKQKKKKTDLFDRLGVVYNKLLLKAMNTPRLFISGVILAFTGAIFLFPKIPFLFFPDADRNLITVDLELPLGSRIEETEKNVKAIEEFMASQLQVSDDWVEKEEEGIVDWVAFIGEGPASYDLGYAQDEPKSSYAHILVNTTSDEANSFLVEQLEDFCFQNLPDAEASVSRLGGGGGATADVEYRISGDDMNELFRISEAIKQEMNQIPYAKNIEDDWGPKSKKFIIDIDQERANKAGLTNQDIATSLKTALSGNIAGDFREGDNNIPIVMRSEGNTDIQAHQLENINIFAQNSGKNVPLIQVASIIPTWQFASILRRNLFRTITVSCNVKPGHSSKDITNHLTPIIDEQSKNWKQGYFFEVGGESEDAAENMGSVFERLPLAGFIILLLLVLQFNSIRKTFIVLSTIPLGIIGVVIGLLAFRSYFGFMSFLGIISLAGIVINNAIVLIDRIQLEKDELGKPHYQAILDAARQRFRPILLTTFTTVLGLIPLYLGGGIMWEPMAIAIMIGLLFATVITLLFVPILYKLLFKVSKEP